MLTIVLAAAETITMWPGFFFGCDDESVKQDFLSFLDMVDSTDWHFSFDADVTGKDEEQQHRKEIVKPCYSQRFFWWRVFSDNEVKQTGLSDNESLLTRQELIDMCNFNIKSGHVFKCKFAAKTYLWLCDNRSKISSITFN